MLKTQHLTFSYTSEVTFQFPDIYCDTQSPFLILGESGKGKTTLLHLLAGLLRPVSGNVYIGGTDISKLSTSELDQFRGRNIGLIFQEAHFAAALTVKENLLLAQYLAGEKQDSHRVENILSRLNLVEKLHQKTYRLSTGQQQRVAIARALINKPQVILADEPTSSLDDTNCQHVVDLLEEQAATAGATLVIVTHDHRLKSRFEHQLILP